MKEIKWIYIRPYNSDLFHIKGNALASVINMHKDIDFKLIHQSEISKYFKGLYNVEIGYPNTDSQIINLNIPEYLNFGDMCNFIEKALNLQHKGNFKPYIGFVDKLNEVDTQLQKHDNIILFAYYSNLNDINVRIDDVIDKLKQYNYVPICCGSKDEHLLHGALDFRELIRIDEIIKNKSKIKAIVTSNRILKEICYLLNINVIYLFTHCLLLKDEEGNINLRTVLNGKDNLKHQIIKIIKNPSFDDFILTKLKFEVPYNFDEILIEYYSKRKNFIAYLFLPPFSEDLKNARTGSETSIKGRSYMPSSREEYEYHLHLIKEFGLHFVVLWQDRKSVITKESIDYYVALGASGFIIGNDKNAKIIKSYNSSLIVIGSIVQCRIEGIKSFDFSYYDKIVMFYPFMRSLECLKELENLQDKIIIMPNSFCHTDCKGLKHWFIKDANKFKAEKDCLAFQDSSKSTFIYPEHLKVFDNYVSGYKLQGREWTSDYIVTVCESYFNRKTLASLVPPSLEEELQTFIKNHQSLEEYYNIKSKDILGKI